MNPSTIEVIAAILFVLGVIYCLFFLLWVAPRFFGEKWLERAIFSWGWATAAVANAGLDVTPRKPSVRINYSSAPSTKAHLPRRYS